MTIKVKWQVTDASDPKNPKRTHIKAGTYPVERIDSPLDNGGGQWIVLEGTRIGATQNYFDEYGGRYTEDDESRADRKVEFTADKPK